MSVLIKGLSIPKEDTMLLRINTKGEVYVFGGYATKIFEAIDISDHGDLIDRDELMTHGVYMPREGGNLPLVYMSYVKGAKAVIPAERSEDGSEEH